MLFIVWQINTIMNKIYSVIVFNMRPSSAFYIGIAKSAILTIISV